MHAPVLSCACSVGWHRDHCLINARPRSAKRSCRHTHRSPAATMDSFIDGKSPYEIMGVEKGSSAQAIKKVRRWC